MAEPNRLLDLSDYWRMVRKRIWLPIVFAVIVAGLAAAFILAPRRWASCSSRAWECRH